jgi:hypothetical protein
MFRLEKYQFVITVQRYFSKIFNIELPTAHSIQK